MVFKPGLVSGIKGRSRKSLSNRVGTIISLQINQMKKVIARFEELLIQNKAKKSYLPTLRSTCVIQVAGSGSITVNLSTYSVTSGLTDDADCTIQISSLKILEEIMENPSK